jgi:hypothetical protein
MPIVATEEERGQFTGDPIVGPPTNSHDRAMPIKKQTITITDPAKN